MNDAPRLDLATASRIVFGAGTLTQAGRLAAELGARALVVTGGDASRAAGLLDRLREAGVESVTVRVSGEPDVEMVGAAVDLARREACDLVIAIGGGSVIDAGKAIAALLTNGGAPLDYLEGIGAGAAIRVPSAPFMAIPTTAGTGAEVTKNAVLSSPAHRAKASLRSPLMLPRIALVDPELTHSMPPAVTASTGLDAFTQLLEPFVSVKAQPLTDGFCREGLSRAARSLRRAWRDGDDTEAREDMALASLLGGLALANAGLGAVHGFAAPLGGRFPAPHGAVCARLLPIVAEANIQALRQRAPASPALARYAEAARIVTGNAAAALEEGTEWIRSLCCELDIPALSAWGVTEADFPAIIAGARRAGSMKGNPIELTDEELTEILRRAS